MQASLDKPAHEPSECGSQPYALYIKMAGSGVHTGYGKNILSTI